MRKSRGRWRSGGAGRAEFDGEDYQALGPAGTGLAGRAALATCAVLACFLNAGLIFGFSALYPALVAEHAFADVCHSHAGVVRRTVCEAQELSLSGIFTFATSGLYLLTFPSGAVADCLGPRGTASVGALLVSLGCGALSLAEPSLERTGYYGGFLLMALGGQAVFLSTASFANLFPGSEGIVTAASVGSFSASSAVFIGLASLIDRGVPFGTAFAGYALVPLATVVTVLALWPKEPFTPARGMTPSVSSPAFLATLPLADQVTSHEFLLLAYAFAIATVYVNFFMATVNQQLEIADPRTGSQLAHAFATILPLAGSAGVPLNGVITNFCTIWQAWALLWLQLVGFAALVFIHGAYHCTGAAYASFAVFSVAASLLFTLVAAHARQVFGIDNFGKVYGLLASAAGVANFAVKPLQAMADRRGFEEVNGMLVLVLLSVVAAPLALPARSRRRLAKMAASSGVPRLSGGDFAMW